MTRYVLDFNLLPTLQYSTWIYNLGSTIEAGLQSLPETLRRAEAAMFFVYQLACSDDSGPRKEAYLRAALAEFVSMEEALARDLAKVGEARPPLKVTDSNDPILHIAKALRNLEIHLQASKMSSFDSTYWLGPKDKPEEGQSMDHVVWYIDDVTPSAFEGLRGARRYDIDEIVELLLWFNNAQKLWGIYEIVRLAILRYSEQIIDTYRLS